MEKGERLYNAVIFICKTMFTPMKMLVIRFLFYLMPAAAFGQVMMNKDSLLRLLPDAREDTNAVWLYINIGQQYENSEPNVAKQYYRRAGDLSRQINFPKGVIKYISNYTYVLNMQGLYDSSLLLNLQGVEIARETKDSLNLAKTLFNTGTSYRVRGEYEKAVQYYGEGKKLFQKFGNEYTEAIGEDVLQMLYFDMHQYEKGVVAGERAVVLLRKLNDGYVGIALNNLGLNYASLHRYDKAESTFKEALLESQKNNDRNLEHSQYLNLGDLCFQSGDYECLKFYMEKSLPIAAELGLHESDVIAKKGLSFYYQFKRQFDVAERYGQEALAITYQYNLKVQRQRVLQHLSHLAYSMQDVRKGKAYSEHSDLLGDSILNENIFELEKKYETERKESQIRTLEANKKVQDLSLQRREIFIYVLVGSMIVLAIILALSYRTYKQKQILQQQRINELEKEKQLSATEAVLKGEEKERSRLAKDLHDGLGGLLSGIKYSFTTMKENLIMTPENHQAFERGMDMLDSSIKEMRRVAHNMMPESLVRFGLDTALKDFCNDINQSGALQISYQSIGFADVPLDQTMAITVYRIVQELINNTLKHAAAKTAIVQVTRIDNRLSVTVEDDGKGFDTAIINTAGGMGWSNIRSRVDFLKGKMEVESEPGKGTSVQIELSI